MDSLKVISDINEHITELDNKIEKTSKAASVAFAYLYSRIGEIDQFGNTVEDLNKSFTNMNLNVDKASVNSYSYYLSLKGNITDISNSMYDRSLSIENTIKTINSRILNIENHINELDEKITKIVEVPQKYIVVQREPSAIIKFYNYLRGKLYVIFHWKQIKRERAELEEKERLAKIAEEQKRIEAERRLKEEQEKRKQEELIKAEKEKENKINKIKGLLK